MLNFVEFMPEEFAEMVDPLEISDQPLGIISITDPGRKANLKSGWAAVLRLQFDDVDPEFLKERGPDYASRKVLFNKQMARQVVSWLNDHQNDLFGVIVHCWAGISRSGAVAKFIADKYGLPYREGHEEFINQYVYDLLTDAERGTRKARSKMASILYRGARYVLVADSAEEDEWYYDEQMDEKVNVTKLKQILTKGSWWESTDRGWDSMKVVGYLPRGVHFAMYKSDANHVGGQGRDWVTLQWQLDDNILKPLRRELHPWESDPKYYERKKGMTNATKHVSKVVLYRGARYVLVADSAEKPMSDEQPRSPEEQKKVNQALKDSRDVYYKQKGMKPKGVKQTGINPDAGGPFGDGGGE